MEKQSYFKIGMKLILKRKYKSICNSIFILKDVYSIRWFNKIINEIIFLEFTHIVLNSNWDIL